MKTLENVLTVIVILIFLDVAILFASLGQIAAEGRTGYWNPFWATQAEFIATIHI